MGGGWSAGDHAPVQSAATRQRSSMGEGFEGGLRRLVNVGKKEALGRIRSSLQRSIGRQYVEGRIQTCPTCIFPHELCRRGATQ